MGQKLDSKRFLPDEIAEQLLKMRSTTSPLMSQLLIVQQLEQQIKVISDLAFDSVDEDGSNGLDMDEMEEIFKRVAEKLKVNAPTKSDIKTIVQELDEDFDGVVSKEEFLKLVMMVVGQMLMQEQIVIDGFRKDI